MTALATTNTRTRASAPRFKASLPRTLILAFARACCKCMRVRAPGLLASVLLSLVTPPWITRGCGGSILAMARPWMLTSTLTRSAFVWAALGPAEPITCAARNSGILDTGAAHASCCALSEATRGHNAVSSLIHAAAQQCDHTSEMEVPGLIPGTDLRPADILTSALGNAYTALDVSICSPHASEAGTDCTQSRVEAKLEYYALHLAALLRQNISYTPIVWSAYGRPHPDTLTVLRSLSKSIARKRNIASAEVVFHRLHSSITLEIWRRSARQIRTCWPLTDIPANLDLDTEPLSGALFLRLAHCPPSLLCLACGLLVRRCPRSPLSPLLVASLALRLRHSCPWRLAFLVPQGPGSGVSLLTALAVLFVLGSQRIFCPFFLVFRAPALSHVPWR